MFEQKNLLQGRGGIVPQGLFQELGPFVLHAPPQLQLKALGIIELLCRIPETFIVETHPAWILSLLWQKVGFYLEGEGSLACDLRSKLRSNNIA